MSGAVIVLTMSAEEFEQRLEATVARVLDAQQPKPVLLDRAALATALHVSIATVSRLRAEGMPHVMVLDTPRFRLADVIAWLEQRSEKP